MIKSVVVEVEPRAETGKNNNRRLRAAGKVPAIVYGLDRPSFAISVSPRRIEEVLRLDTGRNTIFDLALATDTSKQRSAMIREIQRDPVTGNMVHLDFVRVDMAKTITVDVPIQLRGTPDGVKNEGGVVDFVNRQVAVTCLPKDIPESLEIDISALHINQHVSMGDLTLGEGIKLVDEPDTIIAVVIPPRAEAEPEAEAAPTEEVAAEAEEPEVIKKGKEGEAGEKGEKGEKKTESKGE